MLDDRAGNFTLAGAHIVTPDGVIIGAVDIEDGQIAALRPGANPPEALIWGVTGVLGGLGGNRARARATSPNLVMSIAPLSLTLPTYFFESEWPR